MNNEPNPSLSKEPELEVQFIVAHAQTCAVFFHVACSSLFNKSDEVCDSLVTYGVFVDFFSGAGSRSTLIFGSLGSVTLSEYNIQPTTPSNINIIKIWIANFDCQNILSSNR